MKVAHILPPVVAPQVADLLGYQHLLLPALVTHPTYRQFYVGRAGIDWMTLDNGVAEGRMQGFPHLLHMARFMGAQEVILPDAMGDSDKTLELLVRNFWDAYQVRSGYRFMFVPQGREPQEVVHCAEQAMNLCPGIISCFGIPRHIVAVERDARAWIAMQLRRRYPAQDIHLLGTHPDSPWEIQAYRGPLEAAGVRSVDTSLAWNATLQEIPLKGPLSLSYNSGIKRQPIDEFVRGSFDRADPHYKRLLRDNIEAINSWVK